MTVFQGELWVGGDFNNIGGQGPLDGVVKWDETNDVWVGGNSGVDLIGGVNETVRVLYVNPNDGNLYMGGEFPELIDGNAGVVDYNMSGVAMYDGSDWTPLGTGLNEYCRAIHEYNGNLIVGGYFTTADGVACNKIAKWNGTTFLPMGLGFDASGIDEYVKAAWSWNGTFYAGGAYTQAEGQPMNYIAQWYEAPTLSPTAVFSPSTTSGCINTCVDFTDNSTNSPTSWNWTFPGSSTPTSTDQHPTNICFPSAGTYTVSLQACNGNGCNSTTQDITITAAPTVGVSDQTICEGETTNLIATPSVSGGTYLWSPGGETTQTINVSPTNSSSYTVEYSLNGCTSSIETANVTVNSIPSVGVNNETICEGNTATLIATPSNTGGSYMWSPGGETSQSIVVTPSNTTIYSVEYTLNGCTSLPETSTVTVSPTPTLSVQDQSICEGNSATLNAIPSQGGGTYLWSPGNQTSSSITESPVTNTTYSVVYTLNGCTSQPETPMISVNPNYYGIIENLNICSGGSYTYPDGTTSSNITVNESHISNLTTLDGCDSVITTNLVVNSVFTEAVDITLCSGSDYTYPDGTVSTNITSNEFHISYFTNVQGCDSTIETSILIDPMPNNTVAESNNVLTSNEANAIYQWIDCGTGLEINGETSQTFEPLTNGEYAVEVNMNGCIDTSQCVVINTIGIEELSADKIYIYPNPVLDAVCIKSSYSLAGLNYTVIDARGRTVLKGTLDDSLIINVQFLKKGAYLINVANTQLKFIK
jgi:PKD repeat protein